MVSRFYLLLCNILFARLIMYVQYVQISATHREKDVREEGVKSVFYAKGRESHVSGRCWMEMCFFFFLVRQSVPSLNHQLLSCQTHLHISRISVAPCLFVFSAPLSGFNVNHEVVNAQSFICRNAQLTYISTLVINQSKCFLPSPASLNVLWIIIDDVYFQGCFTLICSVLHYKCFSPW